MAKKMFLRIALAICLGSLAACGNGMLAGCRGTPLGCVPDYEQQPVDATASPASGFRLTSPSVAEGGSLPSEYTCDGVAATLALTWSGAPAGTKSFAVIMHTVGPGSLRVGRGSPTKQVGSPTEQGSNVGRGSPTKQVGNPTKQVGSDIHWYWVLYDIPADVSSLSKNSQGIGSLGTNSVNDRNEYAPPCSKGPGAKLYTYTVYALSAEPQLSVPPSQVTRAVLLEAMQGITLASAELHVTYTRK